MNRRPYHSYKIIRTEDGFIFFECEICGEIVTVPVPTPVGKCSVVNESERKLRMDAATLTGINKQHPQWVDSLKRCLKNYEEDEE